MERSMPKDPTDVSPLATVREFVPSGQLLDGPIRYLLVAGELDDGRWGSIGVLANDRRRERRVPGESRRDLAGSEMVRSVRSAQARGWTIERIYAYWQAHVGVAGRSMIDPQQHADTLFQVARRVGARS